MELILTKRAQRQLDRTLYKLQSGINELSAFIIDYYAPDLWLDFLNADPKDSQSMWFVYRDFKVFMNTLMSRHFCSDDMRDIELLSKEEFLRRYPLEMQQDAENLHEGMREVIDNERADVVGVLVRPMHREETEEDMPTVEERSRAEVVITKGADIPFLSFTIGIIRVEEDDRCLQVLQLDTPVAKHRNLWLSVILEGMLSLSHSHEKGGVIVARRCEAPDCGKYFVPAAYSHGQKYHSATCRSRHNMQKRRQSS